MLGSIGKQSGESVELTPRISCRINGRLRLEEFAAKEGFKPGMKK